MKSLLPTEASSIFFFSFTLLALLRTSREGEDRLPGKLQDPRLGKGGYRVKRREEGSFYRRCSPRALCVTLQTTLKKVTYDPLARAQEGMRLLSAYNSGQGWFGILPFLYINPA